MKIGKVTLDPQPVFPNTDLTSTNAEWLRLMLMNYSVVNDSYTELDRSSYLIHSAYEATSFGLVRMRSSNSEYLAMRHGMKVFTAIHRLVDAALENPDESRIHKQVLQLSKKMDTVDLNKYCKEAEVDFYDNMPLTAGVVGAASERYIGNFGHLAIVGASLMHRFEINTCDSSA